MNIILYHTGCPKCKILASKLKSKNIEYEECADIETMLIKGIQSVPWLEVDGVLLDFAAANKWINERN